jgi:hypothetical protein
VLAAAAAAFTVAAAAAFAFKKFVVKEVHCAGQYGKENKFFNHSSPT